MSELSRRRLLTGAGAAIGVGALGTAAAAPSEAAPGATSTFTLVGSAMRRLGPSGRAAVGTFTAVRGTLHQSAGGAAVGEFFSTGTVLSEQRLLDPDLGWVETHLFTLTDGTITGIGTVHHDGTGAFTITGGSGRYAASRGTYSSRQSADHSGTGEALFTFTLG